MFRTQLRWTMVVAAAIAVFLANGAGVLHAREGFGASPGWSGGNLLLTPPVEPACGPAVVDGEPGEWDLVGDFAAPMFRNGNPAYPESQLYLRFDLASNTLYALVLADPGVLVVVDDPPSSPAQSWIKADGNLLVDGTFGDDGTAPDFAWVGQSPDGHFALGWEASVPLITGSYVMDIQTRVLDGATQYYSGFPYHALAISITCEASPSIDVEKYVSVDGGATWEDADLPPGPASSFGIDVYFKFVVTNNGGFPLDNVTLADSIYDLFGCPVPPALTAGESFTCVIGPFECSGGQHTNTATASGQYGGALYSDSDDANYYGCTEEQPGTGTPGYWKNHPEAWPVEVIVIGGRTYGRDTAIVLMGTPEHGDKTYTMFRDLVAAKLNVLIGNDSSCIADVIVQADAWMAVHEVGSNVRASSAAWQSAEWMHELLDMYNNGLLCAPHRD